MTSPKENNQIEIIQKTFEVDEIAEEDPTTNPEDPTDPTTDPDPTNPDPVSNNIVTFDNLIETLYDAGLKAQRNVQLANLHHLENFFEDTIDGVYKPKVIRILIPTNKQTDNDEEKWEPVDVPIFSLVNHNCLKIENLQVKFKINLGELIKDEAENHIITTDEDEHGIHNEKWTITITNPVNGNDNYAEVTADFKYDEPLESIVRLSEKYSRLI